MNSKDLLQLYNGQLQEFELAKKNYTDLQQAVYRDIPFDLFRLRIQYNPARMISTNARIDARTLQNRKCFLCQEYMPEAQKGIRYNDRYSIFINPYPIFERHFTVPSRHHEPQHIEGRFEDLLDLTFDFQGYTLFYNGPTCGASAPDHFHFQMCPRHLMPLEEDAANEELRRYLVKKDYYSVSILKDYLLSADHGNHRPIHSVRRRTDDQPARLVRQLSMDRLSFSPPHTPPPAILCRRNGENIVQSGMCRYGRPDHFSPGRRFPEIFSRFIDRYVQSGNRRPG